MSDAPLIVRVSRRAAAGFAMCLIPFFIIWFLGEREVITFDGGMPILLTWFVWLVVFPVLLLFISMTWNPPILVKLDSESISLPKWHIFGKMVSIPLSDVSHASVEIMKDTSHCLLIVVGQDKTLKVSLLRADRAPISVRDAILHKTPNATTSD